MALLLAEDLILLLLDDETGRFSGATHLDIGIGGALLMELALAGCVEVGEKPSRWSSAKVRPVPGVVPEDPVLQDALAVVAAKERSAQDLVGRLGRRRRDPLLDRLTASGVLERHDDRLLGLIPYRRWPAGDRAPEADLRRRLGDALVRGVTPDGRTTALIALLSALEVVHKVVDREGHPAREVKRRAKELAEGDFAAKAVKDAVAAAQSAVAVTLVAATAASSGGS